MTAYVALLRAVNVAGKNRIRMGELRKALAANGFENVTTVLQSGNVLLDSSASEQETAATVRATIVEAFGLEIEVVVRSRTEFTAVARTNPFLGRAEEVEPSTLHVAFLDAQPAVAEVVALDRDRAPPDALIVSGREVYLSYPNGSGRSRLTLDYLERALGRRGTARNWRTVLRLAALLEG